MEKRGHHICQVGPYQVRQKVTRATPTAIMAEKRIAECRSKSSRIRRFQSDFIVTLILSTKSDSRNDHGQLRPDLAELIVHSDNALERGIEQA